jgi:hypothetical protein
MNGVYGLSCGVLSRNRNQNRSRMNHDEFCGPWKDVFWMDGGLCESRINKMK